MGIFGSLFGRRGRGKYCACCGRKLLKIESGPGPLFDTARMDFIEAVGRIELYLQMPAYVCEKCGAIVCKGCCPLTKSPRHWKNYPQCPKCGSDMERL